MNPKISIIAAISENKALGKDNKLLWHIKEDLKRFKELTVGHVVIMGRKTFESVGKSLPKRINIVITRDANFKAEGIIVVNSLEKALRQVQGKLNNEIFIIGGGQIYQQAIGIADKLYLTIVKGKYDADTFFPDYSQFKKVVFEEKHKDNKYEYKFIELEK